MRHLVFFLEEHSAKEMLNGLLSQLLPEPSDFQVKYMVFQGKRDLEKRLVKRLQAWRTPDTTFIILLDQDLEDCRRIKKKFIAKCEQAGRANTIVRIACRELESWYFGDLKAVEKGLGLTKLGQYQHKKKYRNPDKIDSPAECLKKVTANKYQKIQGSREIGKHLSLESNRSFLESNRSRSYQVFLKSLRELIIPPDD